MRYISIALSFLALALLACGDGGGTGSETKADGSLHVQYVRDGMRAWVTVVSINDQAPQEKDLPQGVSPQDEMELSLNEIMPVTADLPGGTEVSLKIRISLGRQKDFDLKITIDGSQLLSITNMNPYVDEAGLEYELRNL